MIACWTATVAPARSALLRAHPACSVGGSDIDALNQDEIRLRFLALSRDHEFGNTPRDQRASGPALASTVRPDQKASPQNALLSPKEPAAPAMVLGGAVEFETRFQEARSHCQVAVDAIARELLKPSVQDWMDDKIGEDELKRFKVAAREEAAAGHAPLTKLDQAFAEYNATMEARLRAKAAEDALEATLAELERGQAGPSA